MSLGSAVGGIYKTFNTALNVGVGRGLAGFAGKDGVVKNIGKIGLTMASGAAIGASVGAGLGAASEGGLSPQTGAMVGGAVGAAAIPAAGLAIGTVGNVGVGAAKAAFGASGAVGTGVMSAAPFVGAVGVSLASRAGDSIWSVGKRVINWDEDASSFNKVKFTNPISGARAGWKAGNTLREKIGGGVSGAVINGATVFGLAAIGEGTKKAWNTLEKSRMGQMTGVTRLTPQVPSYSNNAGATGDLVFALNANRRG